MRAMVRGAHFLAVAAMSAVGAAPGAVDEGLLASYDLLRADCVNGTFPDGAGAGGPLVRTASTRCLHGLGVAADGAAPRVTAGAAALRDALGASAESGSDGLTVELWLRLDGVGMQTDLCSLWPLLDGSEGKNCEGCKVLLGKSDLMA